MENDSSGDRAQRHTCYYYIWRYVAILTPYSRFGIENNEKLKSVKSASDTPKGRLFVIHPALFICQVGLRLVRNRASAHVRPPFPTGAETLLHLFQRTIGQDKRAVFRVKMRFSCGLIVGNGTFGRFFSTGNLKNRTF